MTNAEKFKSVEERAKAFDEYCHSRICNNCPAWNNDDSGNCRFSWLDEEAEEEKPLPCPLCGEECEVVGRVIRCRSRDCGYEYYDKRHKYIDETIAAHNRLARIVMESGKKEEK